MSNLGSCHTDSYLEASYNGIPFTALEVTSEHGRRTAIGEFPFSNEVGAVDMGRKVRRYQFRARFDNDNHQTMATALIAAAELPGPGILVHPTRGVINATVESLRVTNDIVGAQGITSIELTLVEFNLWNNGLGLVGSLLGLLVRPLLESSSTEFEANYSVRSEPLYLQGDVEAQATAAALLYASEYARNGSTNPRAYADMVQVAEDPVLRSDPDVMNDLVRLGTAAVYSGAATPVAKYNAMRRIANAAVTGKVSGTNSGEALATHQRIVAAGYMAQAALARNYTDAGQAMLAMDQVNAVLDQETRLAYERCDNAMYLSLVKYKADFTRRMYQITYGAPRKQQYDFGGAVNPLVAAYAIWDDATRSRELGSGTLVGPIVVA